MATKKTSSSTKNKKSRAKTATKKSTSSANAGKRIATEKTESVKSNETKTTVTTTAKKTAQPDAYKKLNGWNMIFALLYVAIAAAIVIYGNNETRSITSTYLTEDPLAGNGSPILVHAVRTVFELKLTYFIALILGVAALKHILVATVLRPNYESDLKMQTNRSRWLGHGVGDGLAVAGVGLIVGISDFVTLFALFSFVLIATTAVISAHKHIGSSHKTGRMTFWVGVLLLLAPWLMIGKTMWAAKQFGSGLAPTNYMYILAGVTFVLYMMYMLVERMRHANKDFTADYTNVEWVYMLIGFALKATFAGVVFNYILK